MLKSKRPNRIIYFILASLIVHIALVIAVSLYHRKKTLEMEKEQQKPMTLFVEQIEEPEPPGPVPPEKQESPARPEPPPEKPPAPKETPQEPPAQEPQPQKTPAPAEPDPNRKLPEQKSPVQERPPVSDPSGGGTAGSGRGGEDGADGGTGPGSGPSMKDRFADLLSRIERYKSGSYPLSARKLGLEGTVVVRLTLDASGALTSLSVAEECPHRSLNEAALELVRRVLREPYPHGLESAVRLTIPIVFKLD